VEHNFGSNRGADALSFMGDGHVHLRQIEQAREIAIEQGADFVINAVCTCHEGIARVELGDFEKGYEVLTSGTELWNSSGGTAQNPMLNTLRRAALVGMNRTDQAIHLLKEVIEFVDRTGHKTWWPEPYRLLGRAHIGTAKYSEPEATHWFTEAIKRARAMDAKSYELRAARDLARLWAEQKERWKAYELLAPVFGRFTEGFDTRDLKDARALLDELA